MKWYYFAIAGAGLLLSVLLPLLKKRFTRKAELPLFILCELALSALFCVINANSLPLYDLSFYLACFYLFSALSFVDLKEKEVDMHILLAFTVFATVSSVRTDISFMAGRFIGAAVGLLLMLLIRRIKRGQVGKGDVYAVAALGLALGLAPLFRAVVTGMIIMGVFCGIGLAAKKLTAKSELPMLPFLCAGWALCVI